MNPILLDERLSAAAELAREALTGMECPVAADIGCDHGFLTAKLLETVPNLTMLASDVSAPSLEKARRLLAARGLSGRATLAVADGLSAIDRLVDAVMILGMGAGTILKIVSEGRDKIGGAALIVQANVDLPLLRGGLAELGFAVQKEIYCRAAGRHYVTMLARAGMVEMPDERHLTLGACADGAQNAEQYDYLAWQRGVRVREMLSQAGTNTPRAKERLLAGGHELNIIAEAIGMGRCTVSDIEKLVGEIAPFELAEEWDNVGLLFGCRNAEVTRVVVTLDLTQKAVDQAKALGAQLIVTHHPIMFSAVKRVTDETREGRLMLDMGRAGISHIAAHTNLDAAKALCARATWRRGRPSASSAPARRRSCTPACARSATRIRLFTCWAAAPAQAEAKSAMRWRWARIASSRAKCAITRRSTRWTKDAASSRQGTLKRKTRSAKCSPTLYKMRRMRYNIT